MPTHFHWIVEVEPEKGTISDIMRDLKKYSAWDCMEYLKEQKSSKFSHLYEESAIRIPGQKRQFWMHRFDDEVIRSVKMFWIKLNYIHKNPVKAALVEKEEDYLFSSARNYITGDQSSLKIYTRMSPI